MRQFVLFALLGVMLFFLMNLAVRESMLGFAAGIPAAVFVAVVLLGCLVLVNVAPQVHLRRHWRQRSGIFQPQEFEFTEEYHRKGNCVVSDVNEF